MPLHSQSVEQEVKLITKASKSVYNFEARNCKSFES